ncbi:MAG: multiple sugar transport system permease protein [Thermosipho sp. (in: thermotogales)]|nr:multiple sugar transport system permease protein [Thermosipho sp. (in: thermotogales)]
MVKYYMMDILIITLVFVFILIFTIFPAIYAILSAFISNNGISFGLLCQTLKASYFYQSLFISFAYSLTVTLISTFVSFFLAKWMKKYKTITFLLAVVWIIPPYIGIPIWRAMLENTKFINLYSNPFHTFFSASLVSSWFLIPFSAFFIYSVVEKINKKYFEAFSLESNNFTIYYLKIVFPNIKNEFYSILLLNFINAFKDFQTPWLLTEGGAPTKFGLTAKGIIGSTTNLEVLIYKFFNSEININELGAISTLTIFFISFLIFVWYKLKNKQIKTTKKTISLIRLNLLSYFEVILIILWIFSIIVILYSILHLSFSDSTNIFLKGNFTLNNFRYIISDNFLTAIKNSLFIAVFTGFFTTFLSSIFAFKLSNYKNGEKFISFLNSLKIITGIHLLVFIFFLMAKVHLLNTLTSIILLSVSRELPLGTLLFFSFYKEFPRDLFYLSKLDGVSSNIFFWKILIPNSIPIMISIFLLGFLASFNAFISPLILLFDEAKYPISIKLFNYVGTISNHYPEWNYFSAGSILNLLILLVIIFILRKFVNFSYLKDL